MTWTAELLVEREVYYCMSGLVDMLLEKGIFDRSELEQKGTLPTEDELKEEWEDEWEEWVANEDNLQDDYDSFADYLENYHYRTIREEKEIFEWWLVSGWLARQLKEEGEPILDNGYGVWWGRTTTGQAISMDEVMRKLAEELNQ